MKNQSILKITPIYQFNDGKCHYQVGFDGVTEIKGLEYSPELAHAAWKTEKKKVIQSVANVEPDIMVKKALLSIAANL